MMHYFIVGGPQTGKSVAAGLVLAILGIRPGGFRLAADDFQPDGSYDIYMLDCKNPADFCGDHNLMYHRTRHGSEHMEDGVFDLVGAPLLFRSAGSPLILMDELSELHSEEAQFQKAVLDTLDGSTLVLGVVRDSPTPFLNTLRRRPDVSTYFLTPENKNILPFQIAARLKTELSGIRCGCIHEPPLRGRALYPVFPNCSALPPLKK